MTDTLVVDLKPFVRHLTAPNWYACAFGTDQKLPRMILACPFCETSMMGLKPKGAFIVEPINASYEVLITADQKEGTERRSPSDGQNPGIWIPIACENGHSFHLALNMNLDNETLEVGVHPDESTYEMLFPAERKKWE